MVGTYGYTWAPESRGHSMLDKHFWTDNFQADELQSHHCAIDALLTSTDAHPVDDSTYHLDQHIHALKDEFKRLRITLNF